MSEQYSSAESVGRLTCFFHLFCVLFHSLEFCTSKLLHNSKWVLFAIMDKNEIIPIKLNGKNYYGWAFHLKHFVAGKGLPSYLDGTVIREDRNAAAWDQNNSKVVTWILNSIDTCITLWLQSFSKASEMWTRLRSLYHQVNKAWKFFLDSELAKYDQGDKTVQE